MSWRSCASISELNIYAKTRGGLYIDFQLNVFVPHAVSKFSNHLDIHRCYFIVLMSLFKRQAQMA